MPGEVLSFDLLVRGEPQASRNFRQLGDAALGTSGKLDLAAVSLKAYNAEAGRSIPALRTMAAAAGTHAKATKTLADAERLLAGDTASARHEMDRAGSSTSRFRSLADDAAASLEKTGGGLQGNVTGMSALAAAGVALAPVIVTVGAGLGGLGIAAAGIIGPVIKAAEAAGGLQANLSKLDPAQRQAALSVLGLQKDYQGFQTALKPVVLQDFNAAVGAARPLLHGLEPVAQSTGKALADVFGQIGATFRSSNWQQFMQSLAQDAGPELRALGSVIVSLIKDLPGLVNALRPVSDALLTDSQAAAQLVGWLGKIPAPLNTTTDAAGKSSTHVSILGTYWRLLTGYMTGGTAGMNSAGRSLVQQAIAAGVASRGLAGTGLSARTAAGRVQSLRDQIVALTGTEEKSLSAQLAYTGALITQRTDARSLAAALKASGDRVGYHSAAQRASFSAANTYISDLLATASAAKDSGHGLGVQIRAIQSALPLLESARSRSHDYWAELTKLKQILDAMRREQNIVRTVTVRSIQVGSFPVKAAAAGALITGGIPGRDSVPILTMPGELVVPTKLVRAGAVDHLRGRIPGFGAGGITGDRAPMVRAGGGTLQTVNITINVDPSVAAANPELGQQLAQHLMAHTKRGGRLYPIGTAPR